MAATRFAGRGSVGQGVGLRQVGQGDAGLLQQALHHGGFGRSHQHDDVELAGQQGVGGIGRGQMADGDVTRVRSLASSRRWIRAGAPLPVRSGRH